MKHVNCIIINYLILCKKLYDRIRVFPDKLVRGNPDSNRSGEKDSMELYAYTSATQPNYLVKKKSRFRTIANLVSRSNFFCPDKTISWIAQNHGRWGM